MGLLLETLLAVLASIGIWAICGMLYDHIMNDRTVFTLVCAYDNADGLRQTIRWLLKRSNEGNILIADCGLSEKGRAEIYKIMQEHIGISFLPQNYDEKMRKKQSDG